MLVKLLRRELLRLNPINKLFTAILNKSTLHVSLSNWDNESTMHQFRKFIRGHDKVYDIGTVLSIDQEAGRGEPLLQPSAGCMAFIFEGSPFIYKETHNYGKEATPSYVIDIYGLNGSKDILEKLFVTIRGDEINLSTISTIVAYNGSNRRTGQRVIPLMYKHQKPCVADDIYTSVDEVVKRFAGGPAEYVKNSKQYKESMLLSGPPGTGKTTLARHMAAKYNIDVICLTPEYFLNSIGYYPDTPKIVLIDDLDRFDSICIRSEASAGKSGRRGDDLIATRFMNYLSGITPLENVCIIAGANNPDNLIPALIRQGRFDTKLYVGYIELDRFLTYMPWGYDRDMVTAFKDGFDTNKLNAGHVNAFNWCKSVGDIASAITQATLVIDEDNY